MGVAECWLTQALQNGKGLGEQIVGWNSLLLVPPTPSSFPLRNLTTFHCNNVNIFSPLIYNRLYKSRDLLFLFPILLQ